MSSSWSIVKFSKVLSYYLRHHPDELGLVLEEGGWVEVSTLLTALEAKGVPLTRDSLREVVETSDKKRFSLDPIQDKIRANQGHSIAINLQLTPMIPPVVLYHGTAEKNIPSIKEKGLLKMSRHHVHLSSDKDTAYQVGKRWGKPVIFGVDAQGMQEVGYFFYCSVNGVWLVDRVPPQYLHLIDL